MNSNSLDTTEAFQGRGFNLGGSDLEGAQGTHWKPVEVNSLHVVDWFHAPLYHALYQSCDQAKLIVLGSTLPTLLINTHNSGRMSTHHSSRALLGR